MRTSSLLVVTTLLVALTACDRRSDSPTGLRPSDASLARVTSPTATFHLANDAAYRLRGDGAYLEGGASRYRNGECGVSTTVYALSGASGDATMNTGSTGKCRRTVRLSYALIGANGSTTDDGAVTTASFLNVRKLHVTGAFASYIPVGDDSLRTFALDDGGFKCGTSGTAAVAFVPVLNDGTVTGADRVNVHRDASDMWTVSSQADEIHPVSGDTIHHDKAYCRGNGQLYHMPLRFTIRSSAPLSP